MKTKLLILLTLCYSYFSHAQWSQVGSAQFTNFTTNSAISFHPTTGEPYIVYDDVTDASKAYVMRFDGSNWIAVGGSISSQASANHAIKFNPVTYEPWVAYRRTSDNQMDVYSFDGTNWMPRGVNLNYSFEDSKIQIQFNFWGDARVAGRINSEKLRIIQFPGGILSVSALEEVLLNSPQFVSSQYYDFVDYNSYFISSANTDNSSTIGKKDVGSGSSVGDLDMYVYRGGTTIRQVSGVVGKNLVAAYRDNNTIKEVLIYNNSAAQTFISTNKGIVKIRESMSSNKNYLMYSDINDNLSFSTVSDAGNLETALPSPGISTSNTNFFVDMEVSSFDGDLYVSYFDSGKISLKKYDIPASLAKYYVNINVAGGNGSGDSWGNAASDLSSVLSLANSSTSEVWLAAGTYKPGLSRIDKFELAINGLSIYGGFNGTETSISDRDISNNPTILSGDLNGDDTGVGQNGFNRLDNSKNVVFLNADNLLLDGLTISDGHNESPVGGEATAILKSGNATNVTLRNCNIINNYAYTAGVFRARYYLGGSLTVENCKFDNNNARYASAIYLTIDDNQTVNVAITNSLFTNNISKDRSATYRGYTGSAAWIRANGVNSNLTTTITNCTFANNTDTGTQSGSERGPLALARRTDGSSSHNATINNSVFYNNIGAGSTATLAVNKGHVSMPNLTIVNNSIDEDNFSNLIYLTNTSNANPLFTDANNNNFTLQAGSPAIDAGDNSLVPSGVVVDLLHNARIYNTTVDMGVYEFGSATLGIDSNTFDRNDVKIYPNPTSSFLQIQMNGVLKYATIYSVLGIKIKEVKTNTINVSSLESGIYLIRVTNENGQSFSKRFVKN